MLLAMLFQLQGIHMAILIIKIQSILLQEILQLLKIRIREFLSMIQFRAKYSETVKFWAEDKFRVEGEKSKSRWKIWDKGKIWIKGEKSDRRSNFPEGSNSTEGLISRGSNRRVHFESLFQGVPMHNFFRLLR